VVPEDNTVEQYVTSERDEAERRGRRRRNMQGAPSGGPHAHRNEQAREDNFELELRSTLA
jgi:hypothetical protein